MSIRVVLVGVRSPSRDALAAAIDEFDDIDVVAADESEPAVQHAEQLKAQVAVVTTPFTGTLSTLCGDLHRLEPRPQVILVDADAGDRRLLHAIEAGVNGYVPAVDGATGVAEAIRRIVRGEAVIPSAMLGPLLRRLIQRRREAEDATERLVDLTRREREVLALLVNGLNDRGIAEALFISPDTARTHLQRILRKLGVHSRKEAITLVSQNGLAERLEHFLERSRL